MKTLAVILFVVLIFDSCKEEEIDQFPGVWEYKPTGLPVEAISFHITLDGSQTYRVDSVVVDGEVWPTGQVWEAEKGQKIKQLSISLNIEQGIGFLGLHPSNGNLMADSVVYGSGVPRVYTWLFNQTLTKK